MNLSERLEIIEYLTTPEPISPLETIVVKDSTESVVGGLMQTQNMVFKLGQEHPQLGNFLEKFEEIDEILAKLSLTEMLDHETMKSIISTSTQELEFLICQLKEINELQNVIDKPFSKLCENMAELARLIESSPAQDIRENYKVYLEILQDYYLYVSHLSAFFMS